MALYRHRCRWCRTQRRERTTTRVSSNAHTTPSPSSPPSLRPLSFACMVPSAKTSAIGGPANPFLFSLDTGCSLSCRYRDTAKVLISQLAPRTPARPVLQNAHPFPLISHPRSRTHASSDNLNSQCYLHHDQVSRLALVPVPLLFTKPSLSVLQSSPPGVPGSGCKWVQGAVAYIAYWPPLDIPRLSWL